ncbi:MAG: outer membrane beta-barrel protein, partial [Bacteroidia bacterium]|nr:outer membrane beta-barrel protein [Bacteroidia bacterium]
SETKNTYLSNLSGYNISAPILYRHSFLKKGRTLSVNLNPSINANNGNGNLLSINNYYDDTLNVYDTIDQRSFIVKSGYSSYGNITFTEAFGKKHFVSLNISNTYNYSESDKNTFSKSNVANDYTIKDSIVSNSFNNTYLANLAGISYRFNQEKTTISFGVNAQEAYLNKNQFFPRAYSSGKIFTSILPNGMFMYRFSKQNNFRMFYRSSNNPPSIDQMQDVLNNSNTLQLSIGNPNLKQNFQHNLNIRFSGVNTLKSTASFILLSGTYTDNYIGNSTIIANNDTVVYSKIFLAKGSQISRPENLNNYYTLRFFANYSFPAKLLKSNINLSAGCNYNNIPALINNELNYSNTTSPNFGAVISSNFSEKVDFTLSSNTSYNSVVNSLQKNLNSNFINQSSKAKVNLTIAKKLVLQAEYNHVLNGGLSSTFNQNISLLNAAIAFKFLKDNKGELRLFAFDILNQNRSIQRNVTETYIEDTRTTILQRYFMLTFTYNFKNYFKKDEGGKGK